MANSYALKDTQKSYQKIDKLRICHFNPYLK